MKLALADDASLLLNQARHFVHIATTLLQRGFLGYVQYHRGLHEDLLPQIDMYCTWAALREVYFHRNCDPETFSDVHHLGSWQ